MGVVHKCGGPRRCSSSDKQTEHNMKNDSSKPGLSRRRWFAGAGTIGAVAAVAAALPRPGWSPGTPPAPSRRARAGHRLPADRACAPLLPDHPHLTVPESGPPAAFCIGRGNAMTLTRKSTRGAAASASGGLVQRCSTAWRRRCRRWTGAASCAAPAWAGRRPGGRPAQPGAQGRRGHGRQGRRRARSKVRRTVCSHCSVGCAVDAVVDNGVWVRQEPVFDSPINLGSHCARGACCASMATASTACAIR